MGNNTPSNAIRKYHKQNLKLAENAIDKLGIDKRFVTSFSIPTRAEKLKEVQNLISSFREKLSKALEDENPEDIYTCAIQFFPITKE